MAFFQGVGPPHVAALWHVGCGGLLRATSTGKFLSADSSGTCSLVERPSASVWYFVSRDSASAKEDQPAPRCAVFQCGGPGSPTRFLALHAASPKAGSEPAAVRVIVPADAGKAAGHHALHLQQVKQDKLLLSCRRQDKHPEGALSLTSARAARTECFELDVSPLTLGRGVVDASSVKNGPFVSLAAGVLLSVLELSVRFRLRSAHGRVLQKPPAPVVATPGSEKKPRVKIVTQNGPKTEESESSDRDLVLEAIRRGSSETHQYPTFSFRDPADGAFLSVDPSNKELTGPLLDESVAVLIQSASVKSDPDKAVLSVSPAASTWGSLSVGGSPKASAGGNVEWLMAGVRGRLETRQRTGAWESFRVEVVEQSYQASLKELPMSDVFAEADAADRALIRAEIAAQVSASRGRPNEPSGSDNKNQKSKGAFNHAAALSALSMSDEGPATATSTKPAKSSQTTPKGVSRAEATAALPRNAANRSGKRTTKKKRKQAQNQKQQGNQGGRDGRSSNGVGNQAAASASSGPSQAKEDASTSGASSSASEKSSAATGSSSQSAPVAGAASSGKPCAACGRAMLGSYTKAQGKEFHPQCFACRMCRRPLLPSAGQYHERGGAPYCTACYANNLAPKCARCSKPIVGTTTTAMDKTWHKECLTCTICRLPLTQTFWLYADKPNEPRCSRCVTGSEEALPGVRYGGQGRRNVNLPGPLFGSSSSSSPLASSGTVPGRARITTPVLPPGGARR